MSTPVRTTVAGIAVLLCVPVFSGDARDIMKEALGGGPYVGFGIGYGGGELSAATTGVNHPTRCDRLLYANPQNAPSGGACADNVSRQFFAGSFGLGAGLVGSASVGYAWGKFRVEAEFLSRAHPGESLPALAVDNEALLGKQSEWSAHMPPRYQITDFKAHQLFANAFYALTENPNLAPYVGVGVGYARISTDYSGAYVRSTIGEGYAAGSARPEEWQLAAAGTISALDAEIGGQTIGYQVFAGVDHALTKQATLYVMARWSQYGELTSDDVWTTVRSHAPVQADGVTPFRTDQTLEDISGYAVTVGLRHSF